MTAQEPSVVELLSRVTLFRSLHDDPRWNALLRRAGMSPEQLADTRFEVRLPK